MDSKRPIIVFDFGGVLLDWNPFYLYGKYFDNDPQAVSSFLNEIGFAEWNKLNDAGRPFAQGIPELIALHPHRADLIRLYDTDFPRSLSGAIEGSAALVRRLYADGYTLYGLSNWSAEKFHQVRPSYDFFDCFTEIVLSGEVGINKPDLRIFQILLDRIGLPAQECLLIDDASANIASAQALGFQTIRFEDPESLEQELASLGILS